MQWGELADRQHETLAAKLAKAGIFFGLGNLLEPIEELQLQDEGQFKGQTQNAASLLEFGAAGTIVQTKMADTDKAIGQDMGEKTADKLRGGEGHQFLYAIVAVVEILESDRIFANGNNAMIGDGDAENVTPQILDQFLFVIERGLDKDLPIFG